MQSEQSAAVKAGIFVLIGGAVVIGAILLLGQREQLFSPRFQLVATFRNAGGLIRGAAVRVAGVNAGTVRTVDVVPSGPESGRVRVVLEISEDYRTMIRQGSRASLRTLGPLGDKYVEITIGSLNDPVLKEGGPIATEEAADFYDIAEEARETFRQANQIAKEISATLGEIDQAAFVKNVHATADSLARLLAKIEEGPSLAHTVLYDEEIPKMFEDLRVAAQALRKTAEQVQSGHGALGMLVNSRELETAMSDLAAASASAKSILQTIEKGDGTAHALIYSEEDRAGLAAFADASRNMSDVLAKVNRGEGSLGMLVADPEVWESLKRLLGSAEESRILKHYVERSIKQNKPNTEGARE